MREIGRHPLPRWTRLPAGLRWLQRRLHQFNPTMRARSNVAHHYDIDPRIYELFLDADRQYSCAYFDAGAGGNLEEAHLPRSGTSRRSSRSSRANACSTSAAAGAAWRSTSPRLQARRDRRHAVSREQLEIARDRASQRGLSDAVRFELEDYRKVEGTLRPHRLGRHVRARRRRPLRRLLPRGARAPQPTTASPWSTPSAAPSRPPSTDPFIAKYIFPGGYIPALSEIVPAIERSGSSSPTSRSCACTTPRRCGPGGALPGPAGQGRGHAGERFCRMWEFYLAAPRRPSATADWWYSRSSWPSASTPCRSPATTSWKPSGVSPPSNRATPRPTRMAGSDGLRRGKLALTPRSSFRLRAKPFIRNSIRRQGKPIFSG